MNLKNYEKRLTEDAGQAFEPTRYSLISRNDAIIEPYKTYDLFYEITFEVLQKLGLYEDLGTPEELTVIKAKVEKWETQYIDNMNNPLEPLKLVSALNSEIFKLNYRKENKPDDISILDYTIIYALKKCLELSEDD